MNWIKLWIGKAGARLAAWSGSPAPNWYSAQELWEVLRREESAHMANRLSVEYAKNLQQAFNKGYEMGVRKGKQENIRLSNHDNG
jgi:flagellar biosynthesis/type III secretory pathway protein FliH